TETVLLIVPKLPALRLFTGMLKFGWLKMLKACAPFENRELSEIGRWKFFINAKSVSKKWGPRNWLRSMFPKLLIGRVGAAKSVADKHGLFGVEQPVFMADGLSSV